MHKRFSVVAIVVALILCSTTVLGVAMFVTRNAADTEVVANSPSNNPPGMVYDIPVLKDPNTGLMTGESGSYLWVDSVSDQDYTEMMRILYPNGIVDEQGQEIGGVDDPEEVRAAFVAEHTKAFILSGMDIVEIEATPFSIKIANAQDGEYDCLFYQARTGQDYFVYPSEWGGGQTCGFVSASEAGVFLAYTDIGIWQIDPVTLKSEKISTDNYEGKSRAEIREQNVDLYWIDGVYLSPDSSFAAYRTNRDCTGNDTSVWAIDLRTGEERQIVRPAIYNDIVGFLSGRHIVVGASSDTRIVDVFTGVVVPVSFPQLPNFIISGVNNGIVVYTSYADGTSDTTAYISHIEASTGSMTLITRVVGFLGESRFSPSGKTVAIGYGTSPNAGVGDVMLVELATGTQKLLTASVQDANQIDGAIRRFQWGYDDMLIVTAQSESDSRTYIIDFGNNMPSS